ncbi:unnamed protein product, partial [Ascophyllum nodosum]
SVFVLNLLSLRSMPRLGLVIVASLGAQRAAGFTMISSSMRRSGLSGVSGARRGVMAFLGGAAAMPYSRSRWVSTLMSAAAAQSAPGGPSLKVVTKRESAQHPAYEVLEEDFVTEYGATTTLYKHRKSGAEVLSVQIDDDNKTIFPDNAYGVDSGGDPIDIPNLTFEYFKGFHERFYHPGNSRVYFYGDDPPLKRLEVLDGYLSEFDASSADPVGSQVQWQKKKSQPWRVTEDFPAGEQSKDKHMVSVNWLLNDEPLSVKHSLAIELMDDLLVGTSAATLRKALTDSGLGESVIGGGLSSELLQNTFSIGLKGVLKENVPKVEALVLETLEKIAEEGFDQEAIDASINSIEFNLREFNTGSFPRGLSFMLGAMNDWVYNRNPTRSLHFEGPLQELKQDLAAGNKVFEGVVRDLLVNNGHRATVESIPNLALEAEIDDKEKGKLDQIKQSMSDE